MLGGAYFFYGNFTVECYLDFQRFELIPALATNETSLVTSNKRILFQQDAFILRQFFQITGMDKVQLHVVFCLGIFGKKVYQT